MSAVKYICVALTAAILFCGCGNGNTPQEDLDSAVISAQSGKWETALKSADAVLAKQPDCVDALTIKSIALFNLGRGAEAMKEARSAAERDPKNFAAQYMLGLLTLSEPGREAKALDELTVALRMRPDDGGTLSLLATAGSRLNDDVTDLYIDMLPEALRDSAAAQGMLGVYYALRGDIAKADVAFTNSYIRGKADPVAVLNYARFLDYYKNNRAEAIAKYVEYLELTAEVAVSGGTRTLVEGRINTLRK